MDIIQVVYNGYETYWRHSRMSNLVMCYKSYYCRHVFEARGFYFFATFGKGWKATSRTNGGTYSWIYWRTKENGYQIFLFADINIILAVSRKGLYSRIWAYDVALSVTVFISWKCFFQLNVTLTLVFNFIILLSYRAIHVFLVQNISYSVATHEYAT